MPRDQPNLWTSTEKYERYMGRWSRRVAPLFLGWLGSPARKRWIDIGCGTGELAWKISGLCDPATITGIDPSEEFIGAARARTTNADFRVGDAGALDVADDTLDFAVSGPVLNFVPNPQDAIAEMARVVRPGGTVESYVWDYAGQMQIMRYFFDTAVRFDPGSADFDDGIKAPICRPKPLRGAFAAAGLIDVETTAIDIPTPFTDFDDYWAPFLGGVGSAPKYCVSLDEATRTKIREAVRAHLPTGPDGEILLAARAWAVKGTLPG